MKKKIAVIAILLVCLAAPMFAATSYSGTTQKDTFGVGLNLGTNTGVGLKYGMGDFDILANVGLANFGIGANGFKLSGDVAASYQVYDIAIDRKNHLPITVGLGAIMGFDIGDSFGFDLGVVIPVGIEYSFEPQFDVPVTLYFRLAPGISLIQDSSFQIGFCMGAYIGALWMFA